MHVTLPLIINYPITSFVIYPGSQHHSIYAYKAQISFPTDGFINTLTNYLEKSGVFSEVYRTYPQRPPMGSGGPKQAGTGIWIAE